MSLGSCSGRSGRWLLHLEHRRAFTKTRLHWRFIRCIATFEASQGRNNGPLAGVKVLDLSRVLAGPMCVQILGDYGADIIKIEDVGKGDDTRHFMAKGEKQAWKPDVGPMSNYFASINRNKRSICLDLKHEKGRGIFLDLVKTADVVVENFRTGTLEKLNIGYDVLQSVNPRIILGSVTGYGASGPNAKKAGYDAIVGADAGILHVTGERNGKPVRPGLGITDMSTGLFLHGAIMAALYARERTGRGQKVDTSLFETGTSLLINVGMAWLNLGQEAERWGNQHPNVVPYDAFTTKDLHFFCGATNQKQWMILCELLDVKHLEDDARFRTNGDRVEHRDELFPILNDVFASKTAAEWTAIFEPTSLPFAPINSIEKVFAHPQIGPRNMVQNIPLDAAVEGNLTLIGPPVKFSDTKTSIRQPPPLLGQHSEDVLRELGKTDTEIKELKHSKVF